MAGVSAGKGPPFPYSSSLWTFLILPLLYSLHGNSIGDEGAAAIGEALKHNKTLTRLE
jgi:hypothetical protein